MPADETSAPYLPRYCAFIDILGFAEMIGQLRSGAIQATALRRILRTVHETPRGHYILSFDRSDLKAQSMSDSLCLSTADTPEGLAHILYAAGELSRAVLAQGFFVRGAIVKGDLYHNNEMIFGEALVRAYRFEQEVVRYPRIMVASEVVADIRHYNERKLPEFYDRVRQAADGPFFLHILDLFVTVLQLETTKIDRTQFVKQTNATADLVQRRFVEAVDNPKHFEKVQWFAKYWNSTLKSYEHEVKQIVGPGVEQEPAVWG